MQVIIKKLNENFSSIEFKYPIQKGQVYEVENCKIFEFLLDCIDLKIIPKKSNCIHFIDFIKLVTVYSNLKVYNHKPKSFNKNYGNDKNFDNKIELKIIALDFLSSFKITKKLDDFYNYLKYCNAYKDFSKVRI